MAHTVTLIADHKGFTAAKAVADQYVSFATVDITDLSNVASAASQTITTTTTTATRSAGSYLTDGFRVGDFVTFDGSHADNNTGLFKITTLTATVLTTSGLTANTGGGDERCLLAGENLTASEFGLKTITSVEICGQEDIKTRFVVGNIASDGKSFRLYGMTNSGSARIDDTGTVRLKVTGSQ